MQNYVSEDFQPSFTQNTTGSATSEKFVRIECEQNHDAKRTTISTAGQILTE